MESPLPHVPSYDWPRPTAAEEKHYGSARWHPMVPMAGWLREFSLWVKYYVISRRIPILLWNLVDHEDRGGSEWALLAEQLAAAGSDTPRAGIMSPGPSSVAIAATWSKSQSLLVHHFVDHLILRFIGNPVWPYPDFLHELISNMLFRLRDFLGCSGIQVWLPGVGMIACSEVFLC